MTTYQLLLTRTHNLPSEEPRTYGIFIQPGFIRDETAFVQEMGFMILQTIKNDLEWEGNPL